MSRLLGVVEQLYGELGTRALAVYDDALVVIPGNVGTALVRGLRAGSSGSLPVTIGGDTSTEIPAEALDYPDLLAAAPGRRLIRRNEVAAARLRRSMLGLRRDLELDLVSGERLVLRWPPLGPTSRDKVVMPMLRTALGDRLGSSA